MERQMLTGAASRAVMVFSSLGLFLAQATSQVPVDPLSSVGRLSLDACLITAVGVLWKTISRKDIALAETITRKDEALAHKDAVLLTMIEKMTLTMERVGAGTVETRTDLSQLRDSIETLVEMHRLATGGMGGSVVR